MSVPSEHTGLWRLSAPLSVCVLMIKFMTLRPFMFGATIGLGLAAALYMTVPTYAAFINWQLQHPLMWLIGFPVGIALAVVTD